MADKKSPFTPHTSNLYRDLVVEVKERIRSAQYEALKAVNKELVGLYWDIGVATYEITRTLPKALKGQLPSPKDIARLLEDL